MDARLIDRNRIQIALDNNDRAGIMCRFSRPVEIEQNGALIEQRRFRRIQVFRLPVRIDSPPAERDHPPTIVLDWNNQPVAEPVVAWPTIVGLDDKPHLDHRRFVDTLRQEMPLQRIAGIGRETDTKIRDSIGPQPPLPRIVSSNDPRFGAKGFLEIPAGQLSDLAERFSLCLAPFGLRVARRHRHAGLSRQPFDRFGKGKSFRFNQELEVVA